MVKLQNENSRSVGKIVQLQKISTNQTSDSQRSKPHQSLNPSHNYCVQDHEKIDDNSCSFAKLRYDYSKSCAENNDS